MQIKLKLGVESITDYDSFSPTDFRYSVEDLKPYLTEEAFTKYKAKAEAALVQALAERGICSQDVAEEVKEAVEKVSTGDVYEEEKRIHHDVRALVNVMKRRVSDEAKSYIHITATSYDVVDTARAMMYRDALREVIIPDMAELMKAWIDLARREKDTVQIGRTHGQHAEPITFGLTIAEYVDRFGKCLMDVLCSSEKIKGKFSGAVGAYNASSLLVDDPEGFEEEVLSELGLEPARVSTQILPPEQNVDIANSVVKGFGVLANYADDMRHLQRTEIGEVGEPFEEDQVGSSTMPQKRNPINFENVKSAWKEFMPRMSTVYMDQISEHQRDLTNSLSQRYMPELLVMFDSSVRRMIRITKKLEVDRDNMEENFGMSAGKMAAEPLQILLSYYGHSDAHEKIRQLTMKSYDTGRPLHELVLEDGELKDYIDKFTDRQKEMVSDPEKYIGVAPEKVEKVTNYWEHKLDEIE